MTIPPPLIRVLMLASPGVSPVLFKELPYKVQEYLGRVLADMAQNESYSSEFEELLAEMNPAPARVTNHFKWRATHPVRVRLRIPVFPLEAHMVKDAYTTRDLTGVDVSGMVYHLRAIVGYDTLVDYVGKYGIDGLTRAIERTYSRISSVRAQSLRQIIQSYKRRR